MATEPLPAKDVAHIALHLGRLLLANGADSQLIVDKVTSFAERAGYAANLLVSPEALLLTVEDRDSFRTKLGHAVAGMTVDMGALAKLDAVGRHWGENGLDLDAGDRAIQDVEQSQSRYLRTVIMLGMGITAACLTRLFGGGWQVVAVSALVGIVSTVLRQRFGAWHANPIASACAVAMISGLVGAALMRAFPETPPTLCLVAAGMILTPGVPLINGVRDALTGHIGMGIARLALGTITVLAIAFGLFIAATLVSDTFPVGGAPQSLSVVEDVAVSGLAAIGFALLFNVPGRAILACVLCGMVGHGLRTALGHGGLDLAAGSVLGALAAGLLARLAGRIFEAPAVTFAFPGVVAMIPGSYAFRAGVGGLAIMHAGAASPADLIAETASLAITAVLTTAGIAIGLSIALMAPFKRPAPVTTPPLQPR